MLARKTFFGGMMVGGGRIGPRALASAMIEGDTYGTYYSNYTLESVGIVENE